MKIIIIIIHLNHNNHPYFELLCRLYYENEPNFLLTFVDFVHFSSIDNPLSPHHNLINSSSSTLPSTSSSSISFLTPKRRTSHSHSKIKER